LETASVAAPGENQLLVRTRFIGVDPGMRARLDEGDSYAPAIPLGSLVEGASVGQVVQSNNPKFAEGDWVATGFGWQEFALSDGRGIRKISDTRVPPQTAIGPLGTPGITAYFGLLEVGKLQAGETVVVSSAAGAVGSAAGQIAAIKGSRAIGIAGGKDKCRWLKDEIGFSATIDRKAEADIGAAIKRECPQGVDILFDNVGNAMVDAVLPLMKRGGRVVVSGQVADYNLAPEKRPGIKNTHVFITHRIRMEGFVAFDYVKQYPAAWADLTDWILAGKLKYKEDIVDGIERVPEAFIGLFNGENFGRKMVRLT
jgi:NADPH-dependent curcumin reductase CurA